MAFAIAFCLPITAQPILYFILFLMWNLSCTQVILELRHFQLQGVAEKAHHKDFRYFCIEIPLYDKKKTFKYLYDKIYTIGYYSGFYSFLNDNNLANDGNFGFLSKDEKDEKIFIIYVSNASINLEKQMVIPFSISRMLKSWVMKN